MQNYDVTDHQLIELYLSGNPAGLEKLVKRHRQKLFSSIFFLVRNKELAEDIFQDTFFKIINTLNNGNYTDEGKFLPWAVRIARNLIIDYFRKNQRMPMVRDREDYSVMNSLKLKDENIEDCIEREQTETIVRKLIEELPYEQREVVIMRHYGELSFKEIADITDVSINTALGRMRYAVTNLKRMIKQKNLMLAG